MPTNKQKNIIKKLKNAKFYSIVDELNLPRVTVCIVRHKDHFARGLALCSVYTALPDPFEGYFLSWKNAMRAMNRGCDCHLIQNPKAINVINSLKSTLWHDNWTHRAMFDILPNNGIEKKFFSCLKNDNCQGGAQGNGG